MVPLATEKGPPQFVEIRMDKGPIQNHFMEALSYIRRTFVDTGLHLQSQVRNLPRLMCIPCTHTHTRICDPPWNFLYRIKNVGSWKMVRFNPLLCLGVPTQCQRFQFYRGPWGL